MCIDASVAVLSGVLADQSGNGNGMQLYGTYTSSPTVMGGQVTFGGAGYMALAAPYSMLNAPSGFSYNSFAASIWLYFSASPSSVLLFSTGRSAGVSALGSWLVQEAVLMGGGFYSLATATTASRPAPQPAA